MSLCLVFLVAIVFNDILSVSGQCGGYGGGGGGGSGNSDLTGVLVGFLISQAAAGGRLRARQRAGVPPGDLPALEGRELASGEGETPKGKSSILTEEGNYPDWCTWCKSGGPPETEFGTQNTTQAKKEKEEGTQIDDSSNDSETLVLTPEVGANNDSEVTDRQVSKDEVIPEHKKKTWVERIREKKRKQKELREQRRLAAEG